jgi:hypothetical protein
MQTLHHEERAGLTLRIVPDDCGDVESPIGGDDAVRLAILHRRCTNPAREYGLTDQESVEAAEREARRPGAEFIAFPVYMYDHSGTSYSIRPFACPWDSGRAGAIFLRRADFGRPLREAAESILAEYTAWANGQVYGFIIEDEEGEHLDSCWGFIEPNGADGYVLEAGRESLAYLAAEREKERAAEFASSAESSRPDLYAEASA